VDDVEVYAGGDIIILRTAGADPAFLGYALNEPPVQRQKANKGQGDAVVHISANALASIDLMIPKLPEQVAISAIIAEMEEEVDALNTRLSKARRLKHGMMQELLSGRVRLV
jgi:type I restriction enzyme S subunit